VKFSDPIYVIYNTNREEIEESCENYLPLIFDDEIDAEEILTQFNCPKHLCVIKAMMIKNGILVVKFTCPGCQKEQLVDSSIEDILATIKLVGWPICSECGFDMDFNIEE